MRLIIELDQDDAERVVDLFRLSKANGYELSAEVQGADDVGIRITEQVMIDNVDYAPDNH